MEPSKLEQKVISMFRRNIEGREYQLSFPQDAHIQEMWDFVQDIANELIAVNKRNVEAQNLANTPIDPIIESPKE